MTRAISDSAVTGTSAPSPPPVPAPDTSPSRSWLDRLGLDRFSALYLLAIFMVLFGLPNSDTYFTQITFKLVLSEGVITAILALAFLVPLAANTYDLSIGAVMSLSLLLTNWFGTNTDLNPVLGALLAVLACAVIGAVAGFVVVRLRVNSFIATLGMSQIVMALVLYISHSNQITGAFSDGYKEWGRREVFGVPALVLYLLVLALILWFVLEHTPAGRYLFATGGNAEAARLAGVATNRAIWGSLIASASIAGIAGVVYSMKVGTFSTTVGPGYLFPAITAVFFGASQFTRRPNVWGTLVALYALAFGIKGLQLQFTSGGYWIEPAFQGMALILAVALASRQGIIRVRSR